VAGISATAGRSYDWEAMEAVLGLRLPSDYKLMAESFPEGWFRMFARVLLPDPERRLLGDYALDIMDGVRELRADADLTDLDFHSRLTRRWAVFDALYQPALAVAALADVPPDRSSADVTAAKMPRAATDTANCFRMFFFSIHVGLVAAPRRYWYSRAAT
jgi:hypothetical protein